MRYSTVLILLVLSFTAFITAGCASTDSKSQTPVSPAPTSVAPASTPTPAPTEIELVQTPGQFENKELKLKPGSYVFKIVNQGVKHEVGFYLQEKDDKGKAVAGSDAGHVRDGEATKTGTVTLAKGKYVYSCPLNPTPHYVITVE
jgi:plastocyanin